MKFFKEKPKQAECRFELACKCQPIVDKDKLCETCFWYKFIDSGCGACWALPDFYTVPWCKDPCSYYKPKQEV